METEDQNEKNKEDNKADQQVFLTVNDRMKTGFIHRKSPIIKSKVPSFRISTVTDL